MRSVSFGCLNPCESCRLRRLLLKPETIIESVGSIKEKRRENLEKELFHLNLTRHKKPAPRSIFPYIKAIFPERGARRGGTVPLDFHRENSTGVHPYQKLQDLLPQKSLKIWISAIQLGGQANAQLKPLKSGANWNH